jgi:tetratricopeptide (TPR) repeat protein
VALAHARHGVESAERSGGSFLRASAWFSLGRAERMRGEWQHAIDALNESLAIASEAHTGVESDAWRLVVLGESYLGLGDLERARALVDEGLELACAQGHAFNETCARLALVRVLLGSGPRVARAEIEEALGAALELAHATGARAFEPLVGVERAAFARRCGDEEGCERALREAHRQFTEIGAGGHAERLASELALSAS